MNGCARNRLWHLMTSALDITATRPLLAFRSCFHHRWVRNSYTVGLYANRKPETSVIRDAILQVHARRLPTLALSPVHTNHVEANSNLLPCCLTCCFRQVAAWCGLALIRCCTIRYQQKLGQIHAVFGWHSRLPGMSCPLQPSKINKAHNTK